MIFFGEKGSESRECLVTRIEPGPDLTARLTLADYNTAIYNADSTTIPDYDAGITYPPILERYPPVPNFESITLEPIGSNIDNQDLVNVKAKINYTIPSEYAVNPSFVELEYKMISAT
jgi:hypothetical protein